jgi:hypothetical protein
MMACTPANGLVFQAGSASLDDRLSCRRGTDVRRIVGSWFRRPLIFVTVETERVGSPGVSRIATIRDIETMDSVRVRPVARDSGPNGSC